MKMHFGMYFTKKHHLGDIQVLRTKMVVGWRWSGVGWGGVYGSAQISVTKVYGANVRGMGAVNFPEKCVKITLERLL